MIGASKNIWGFDPRSVPNCALWLDPADSSSVTLNGANVSQLNDKSGKGYNMSQSTAGNQPTYSTALNGNRMLTFTQASSTRLSNVSFPAFIGAGAASYFLVEYNMTSASGNPGPFGYSAGPNSGIIYQYNPSNVGGGTVFISGFQPFRDVTTFDVAFYSPVPRISYLNIPNTGSGMVGFINGVSRSVGTQTAGTYSGTFSVGSGTNGFISGNICELIVFNRSLTNSERQQIEGYLAQKWWVILPTSGFIPTSITGCQLWLDGTDRSTMSFSGANITQWRDKSGNARNTTGFLGTPTLTSLNNVPAISFNGSSDFSGSIPGSGTALTVCIVGSRTAGAATNGGVVCFGRSGQPDSNVGSLAITNGNTSLRVMLGTRTANTQFAYIGSQAFMYIIIFDGTNVNTFLNGGAIASPIANTGTFAFTQYRIASRAGNTGNIRHRGTIGEVVVFNSALTVTQRQQMEGYLGNKWGLKTLLPVTQPYYSFRPHLQYFQPSDITGLSVWFDAADMTTITGSSPVTAWRDKSGNQWNATTLIGTAPTTITVNGLNAVSFPASSTLTVSNVSFRSVQSRAIFVVYRVPTSSANYISWFSTQASGINNQGGHNNLVIPTGGGGPYLQSFAVGGAVAGMGADPAVNTIGTTALAAMIHSAVSTASNVVTLNGTSYTLTTNTTASGYGVGTVTYYIGNAYPQPYILCEYILYQREFTVAERQQVEAYLAWKWDITSSLPATHPYKTIPTALTVPPLVDALTNSGINADSFIVKYNPNGTPLWARRIGGTGGGDIVRSVSTDSSGNIVVTGSYASNPVNIFDADGTTVSLTLANTNIFNDVFVVKYNSSGTPIWARRLGSTADDSALSVTTDSSGNIVVAGQYSSGLLNIYAANGTTVSLTLADAGSGEVFIVKYDSSGTPLWARRMGGTSSEQPNSVSTDLSGNIIVTGYYFSASLNIYAANGSTVSFTLANAGSVDNFVVKYDSSGTPLWARRLGGTSSEEARSVSTDSSGNIVVAGTYASNPLNIYNIDGTNISFTLDISGVISGAPSFIVKYDSSGTPLWARKIGGTGSDVGNSVSTDSSGNIIVVGNYASNPLNIFAADGTTVSFTLANSGSQDAFVVKYNSGGTPLWARRMGGTDFDNGRSVSTDSSGNIVVAGTYASTSLNIFAADGSQLFSLGNAGTQNSFVVKYDSSGTPLWARRMGGTSGDEANSVSTDSSGNIVVAGSYLSTSLSFYG